MWTKDTNGQWKQKEFIFNSSEFERNFSRLKTYAKCVNASTYSVTNQLDNIYSEILYQHGFYVELLSTSPDQLVISDVTLNKGTLYNLSLTHTKKIIVENELDYNIIEDEDSGILTMTIRTAIDAGYIKAANSNLFASECGFQYWDDYISQGTFQNENPNLDCYSTSGTDLIPNENIFLDGTYTESDIYDVWNNNFDNQGYSQLTYWTPDKTIDNLLSNFRLIDVASTENVDVTEEWFELIIDREFIEEGMLILLKDQDNPSENGIYEFTNRFLMYSNIFDEVRDVEYFSAYIKEGAVNKEKQYFLDRFADGSYSYGTNATLMFTEGTNYAIRNRVDYKLLSDNNYTDSVLHIDRNPDLRDDEAFDLSVKVNKNTSNEYTYKTSDNANWIIRVEDDLNIGYYNADESGTSCSFTPLNLGFRLNVYDNTIADELYYINKEHSNYIIYKLDSDTNISTEYYRSSYEIKDFAFDATTYQLHMLLNINGVNTITIRESTNPLNVINDHELEIIPREFKILNIDNVVWYFFLTDTQIVQWHPTIGYDIINEKVAKYLIVALNSGSVQLSYIDQDVMYPVRLEKNAINIDEYSKWSSDTEFYVDEDYSDTTQGDWKIEDNTLTLKDTNIIGLGTSGLSLVPKISNTYGRLFDGKDDHVAFPDITLNFTNVIDASFEFVIAPTTIKNNNRVFYFQSSTETLSNTPVTDYSSIEFNIQHPDTNNPRFQIKDGANYLIIDSNVPLNVNIDNRITITLEFTNSNNATTPYFYTGRIWYDTTLVGSSSGQFTKAISELKPLNTNYIGRTSSAQDPLLAAELSEFRISNIVLNPAQIAARYVPIVETDVTYNNIVYYWDLLDDASKTVDKINGINGIFTGGMFTDPTFHEISNPKTILLNQTGNYLYILCRTSDDILDDSVESQIYKINLNTEDVDVIVDTPGIRSMYIENDVLYWLAIDSIYNENDKSTGILTNIPIAVKFTVIEQKIFYLNSDGKICDDTKRLVYDTTAIATDINNIDLMYGQYQASDTYWYNIYLKDIDEKIHILSSKFETNTDMFELQGIYPFYVAHHEYAKKGVYLNDSTYYITDANRVIEVDSLENTFDLDPDNKYWSWNLQSLCAINGYDNYLFIGAITTDGDVQVWRYDTDVRQALLMRTNYGTALFNTDNLTLDFDITNDSNARLFIIKPNAKDVEIFRMNKDQNSIDSLEILLNLNTSGNLTELHSINENELHYINYVDGDKYLGQYKFVDYTNYTFWTNVLEITEIKHKIWVGDFGVALKQNENATGHTLDLLNTYVKFDFSNINLSLNCDVNEYNYIVPTWTGTAWIYGKQGNTISTNDFGENWTSTITNTFNDFNSSSYSAEHGLIVGTNATLMTTTSFGQFYNFVDVPVDVVQNRELTDVLIYQLDKALVVGKSGLILHYQFIHGRWRIDSNILNVEVDIVTSDDLESLITPTLYKGDISSILRINYVKILYTDGAFWLFGDKGYITKLVLQFTSSYIKPVFTFYYDSNFNGDITAASEFIDYKDGIDKILLTTEKELALFTPHGGELVTDSNEITISMDYIAIENKEFDFKTTFIENNIDLYIAGYGGYIQQADFQESTLERNDFIELYDVDSILDEYFKPRMLITDYYLARKINILLRDGNYIIPDTEVSKDILSCVNGISPLFNEDESLEFSVISDKDQPNYLAYQDWYYASNRRAGNTMYVQPYNKKLIAKADLTNYSWEHEIPVNSAYPPDGYSPIIRNELFSGYYHTMLYVDDSFIINANDVIELKVFRSEIGSNDIVFTALLIKDKFIVKQVDNVGGNKTRIMLWTLLNPEILTEFEPVMSNGYDSWKIRVENLNYFNGHLTTKEDDDSLDGFDDTLKGKIQRHMIGDSYELIVNALDVITIKGVVNDETKYANLETIVTFNTRGGDINISEKTYNLNYAENIIYGPNYNLHNFLSRIDTKFTEDYVFDTIVFSGVLNATSGAQELDITANKLQAGENFADELLEFKVGTWIDMTKGSDSLNKIFITDINMLSTEVNNRRIEIVFDADIDLRLNNNNSNFTLQSRFKLGQISDDLNWTDNINFPAPYDVNSITDVENGINGYLYEDGSYYHGWHNYLRTATVYSKILADNEDVKAVISAMVWVNEDNDLKLNIYNWNNDPNFAFRPIDLHEVGIDAAEDGLLDYYEQDANGKVVYTGSSETGYGLKKAISIFETNWNIDDNFFSLINIDIDKYNFILTDGLTLQRLNKEFFWVLNADVRNAVIGLDVINDVEVLRWYKGTWLCGIWENGKWYSGEVYNIKWITGEWYANQYVNDYNVWSIDSTINDKTLSLWYNGNWGGGVWHNGTWYDGTWYDGYHEDGDWFGGEWLNGEWREGIWTGGDFNNGSWLNGTWNSDNIDSIWNNGTWLGGDFENGTWVSGIWDQGADKKSRFGTKSNSVQQSIWRFGIWKNGEFHNGLQLDDDSNTIASTEYKHSVWYNGIWQAGSWYGGRWESGRWENGIWHFGLWRSTQNLSAVEQVIIEKEGVETSIQSRLVFENKHYYNTTPIHIDYNNQTVNVSTNNIINKVTLLGEPDTSLGKLPILADQLGWNSFPISHPVEIYDEYTLIIKEFANGVYRDKYIKGDTIEISGTNGTDSTSGAGCIDETLELVEPPIISVYDTESAYIDGPNAVSQWLDGTWMSGIWENGYWSNGRWLGGIWVNGVWERGTFGA